MSPLSDLRVEALKAREELVRLRQNEASEEQIAVAEDHAHHAGQRWVVVHPTEGGSG